MTTNHDTARPEHVTYRLENSRQLVEWLSGELVYLATLHSDSREAQLAAEGVGRRGGRVACQLSRVCELVGLALAQVDVHEGLALAWILLEQARQQLGFAAAVERTAPQPVDDDAHAVVDAMSHLAWFLQRDLMPWPDDANVVVEFNNGSELPPDPRPDTPLELVPLQLLAHSSMTLEAGDEALNLDNKVMAMAFGEYVAIIMSEAMALLESIAEQTGLKNTAALTDTGYEVADLVVGAFPPAWQAFPGPAGLPRGRGNSAGTS